MNKVRFICEIGSNHNGDLETARTLTRLCAEAGATYVKFQTLKKSRLIAPRLWSRGTVTDNPVWTTFSNLELPEEWHRVLMREAESAGVEFFSSPFYLEAVDLLVSIGVRTFKVASGDITFYPLLERIGRTGRDVIVSTGASDLGEVQRAVEILESAGAGRITLLHCVSNYPPQVDEMNLRAISTLRDRFGKEVGISDHTLGDLIPIAAVAIGATVVEKHITLDRSQKGPDHPFATTVEEFAALVTRIRDLERALGDGIKGPTLTEREKQHRIRRGTYDPITLDPSLRPDAIWLRPAWRTEDLPPQHATFTVAKHRNAT